jgi:hypothetical protein
LQSERMGGDKGERDGHTLGDFFKTGSHDCGLWLFVGGWW